MVRVRQGPELVIGIATRLRHPLPLAPVPLPSQILDPPLRRELMPDDIDILPGDLSQLPQLADRPIRARAVQGAFISLPIRCQAFEIAAPHAVGPASGVLLDSDDDERLPIIDGDDGAEGALVRCFLRAEGFFEVIGDALVLAGADEVGT